MANGSSTDHPVPGLPFINDGRLPLDNPEAIERTGRDQGEGLWGRTDRTRDGGWVAFTTEPKNPAFCWAVFRHPPFGRTVLLIHNRDLGGLHRVWMHIQEGFLHRHGGYWWDGTHWHRPGQVTDRAYERNDARRVRGAVTITAAGLLEAHAGPGRAALATIAGFTAPERPVPNWTDHLARWAQLRAARPDALPLRDCVVDLRAPELEPGRLVDLTGLAASAGIATEEVPDPRYSANKLPEPQHQDQDDAMWWSLPVAEDWAENRRQTEGPRALLSATTVYGTVQPAGLVADHDRLRGLFNQGLTRKRPRSGRLRPPYLKGGLAQEAADDLAWTAASSLMDGDDQGFIPHGPLRDVLVNAVVGSIADDVRRGHGQREDGHDLSDLLLSTVRLLAWYLQRRPEDAAEIFGEICLEARVTYSVPPAAVGSLLHRCLYVDSGFDKDTTNTLMRMALPPSARDDTP